MAKLPDVSRQEVLEAVHKFDADYRNSADWENWQENKAHKYAIEFEGMRYPVKQIVSLATGEPTSAFSGGVGAGQANQFVQDRGFRVVPLRSRNPTWARDELILALDLYLQHRDSPPGANSEEVQTLSEILNRFATTLHGTKFDKYRNPNGVYMRLMNYRALDPFFPNAKGLGHGGADAKAIWAEFSDDPAHCHHIAETIRDAISALENNEVQITSEDEDDGFVDAPEGKAVTRVHRRRERNRKLVARKKAAVLKREGKLECEACGFDFSIAYGKRGQGFIECHHTKPVSDLREGEKTHLDDLALLCANCHRMVHAQRPWLALEELRAMPEVQNLRLKFSR